MTLSAVLNVPGGEPMLLTAWAMPVEVESLPLIVWLFDGGPERALRDIRHSGAALVSYYARDDELTMIHGRNRVAYYTFTREKVEPLTLAQFHRLQADAGIKLGRPLS